MKEINIKEILEFRPSEAILMEWESAVLSLDVDAVEDLLIIEPCLDPDEPLPSLGLSPLFWSVAHDFNEGLFFKQASLARKLIKYGADLSTANLVGLLPADAAIRSHNTMASSTIVGSTIMKDIREFSETPYGNPLNRIFSTIYGTARRSDVIEQICDNHASLLAHLRGDLNSDFKLEEEDWQFVDDFWKTPLDMSFFSSLPKPSNRTMSLVKEFQYTARVKFNMTTAERFDAWKDIMNSRINLSQRNDVMNAPAPKAPGQ
jgi:hypothetical protein